MASVTTYMTKEGKRWKVEWNLPRRMLEPGTTKAKATLTCQSEQEMALVKQLAELANHAITREQIKQTLVQIGLVDEKNSVESDSNELLFEDFVEQQFLPTKRDKWKKKHGHDQRRKIQVVIMPRWAGRTLIDLNEHDIDTLCQSLKAGDEAKGIKQLSFKTVDNHFDLIRQIFDLAHKRGLIVRNPMAFVTWTTGQTEDDDWEINKHADRYFEAEEYEEFLSYFRPDYQVFVEFLVETGLRFSEATALRVCDVDFSRQLITVRRAWKGYYPGGKAEVGPTKNRKWRVIGLTDTMAAKLKIQVRNKGDDNLVFLGTRGGIITNTNFRRDHWNKAMIKAQQCQDHLPLRIDGRNGLFVIDPSQASTCGCLKKRTWTDFTPHVLRHTFATWLIDDGVEIEKVSQLLGHSGTKVTEEVYVHQIQRSRSQHRATSAVDRKRGRVGAILDRVT